MLKIVPMNINLRKALWTASYKDIYKNDKAFLIYFIFDAHVLKLLSIDNMLRPFTV